MKMFPILLLLNLFSYGQDVPYYTQGLDKTQDVSALNQNFRNLSGRVDLLNSSDLPSEYESCLMNPMFCVNASENKIKIVDTGIYITTNTGSSQGICFANGTCMNSAGVGSIALSVNASHFSGNGTVASPLALQSVVTLEGNTFNNASQLVKSDSLNRISQNTTGNATTATSVPTTGVNLSTVTSNHVLKSGDVMTGQLTLSGSTLTVGGNSFSVGGSTLIVLSGKIGVRNAQPTVALDVVSTGIGDGVNTQYWRDSNEEIRANMTASGKLTAVGFIGPLTGQASSVPSSGVDLSTVTTYADTHVNKSGDVMTGQLTTTSSMTMTGFRLNESPVEGYVLVSSANGKGYWSYVGTSIYKATAVYTSGGAPEVDTLSLLQEYDNTPYILDEGGGVSPLDTVVYFSSASIPTLSNLTTRVYYQGSASHHISIQIWDYTTSDWESYWDFVGQDGYTIIDVPIYDPTDHISDNSVKARFHHIENGVSSHKLNIDFVWLQKGNAVGGSADLSGYAKYNSGSNNYSGTGNITIGSMTITGNGGEFGLSVSSNVYTTGYSSATTFYGSGSNLTGIVTFAQLTSTASAVTALENNRVLRAGDTMTGLLTNNYGITSSTAINAGYYQINGSTVFSVSGTHSISLGALAGPATGLNNIAIGYKAGSRNYGHGNITIGQYVAGSDDFWYLTGDNNILIGGSEAQPSSSEVSNEINLGGGIYGSLLDGGTVTFVPAISAPKYYGDGSALTSVNDATKVLKAGDTMTGSLTLSGSTLTVTGGAFSVGGSTLVVSGGKVGIGTTAPAQKLTFGGFGTIGMDTSDGNDTGYLIAGSGGGTQDVARGALFQLNANEKGTNPGDVYFYAGDVAGGDIHFRTGNGLTDSLTIINGGNVGIGTTAPGTKLHVSSGVVYNDGTGAGIYTTGNSTAAYYYGNGSYLTGQADSLRVSTATYLATAPGACVAGQFISGMTADGTKTCGTPAGSGDVVLAATQTFTGSNTFSQTGTGVTTISSAAITSAVIPTITGNSNFSTTSSTVTFSGWVDIGWEKITVTNASPSNQETVTCSAGKIITGCIGRCNGGGTAPLGYYSNANNTCTIYCPSTSNNSIQAICARVK